jgi:hypothetical protein
MCAGASVERREKCAWKGREGRLEVRTAHLDEDNVRALAVQAARDGREVEEGSEVAGNVARLVVQECHAAHAVPQPKIAAISVEYIWVEAQDGMRLVDGQQQRPRRFARRYDV